MSESQPKKPSASDLAQTLIENTKPQIQDVERGGYDKASYVILPKGMEIKSLKPVLDEYKERPERRIGKIKLNRAESFCEIVKRFKGENSVLFGSVNVTGQSIDAKLTAIFDYHPAGDDVEDADNCEHRAEYSFPLSKHFKNWLGSNAAGMSQADFAFFLEARIADIATPSAEDKARIEGLSPTFAKPIEMLELARDLEIYSHDTFVQGYKTSSGEKEIKFKTENVDASGKPVKIPDFFVINLPLFEGGAPQRILVHLRYRKKESTIVWFYDLYNVDEMLLNGFEDEAERIQKETTLPLYFGSDS